MKKTLRFLDTPCRIPGLIAGFLSAFTGSLVLFGWVFHIPLLMQIHPSLVSMKPLTAVAFILSGTALLLIEGKVFPVTLSSTKRKKIFALGKFLAAGTFTIGFSMVVFYLFRMNPSELLEKNSAPVFLTLFFHRIAPATAVNFTFAGIALMAAKTRFSRIIPPFSLAIAWAAFVALAGYSYHLHSFYDLGFATGMALHTSVIFLILTFGILLSDLGHGTQEIFFSKTAGGISLRRLLPAAVLLPFALQWISFYGKKAGFYSAGFETALATVTASIAVSVTIFWNAGKLHSMDLEKQKTYEALLASEALIHKITDAIPGVVYQYKLHSSGFQEFLFLSKGVEALFGVPQEKALKDFHSLWKTIPQEEIPILTKTIETSAANLTTWTHEFKIMTTQGEIKWVRGKSIPEPKLADGSIVWNGIFINITERKNDELKLYESEERQRAILDNTTAVIYAKDLAGRYLFVNRQFESIFQLRKNLILGKTDQDIFPKPLADAFQKNDTRVLTERGPIQFEETTMENGSPHTYVSVKFPLYDQNGTAYAICGISTDITDRKKSEEKQKELLRALESRNQELNEFAFVVSHDLKAPAAAIRSLAGWFLDDFGASLPEKGREQIELLISKAKQMHHFIDGILIHAQAGNAADEEASQISLQDLIPEIISGLHAPAAVEFKIETAMPVLKFPRISLIQIFQNLLENAVKFMDKPQGEIRVGCSPRDQAWEFYVADNGPGIEEKNFERIFQIFQTGPNRRPDSTGLGLAIVKKIVERNGGKISVESKLGKGTTFRFILPRKNL